MEQWGSGSGGDFGPLVGERVVMCDMQNMPTSDDAWYEDAFYFHFILVVEF